MTNEVGSKYVNSFQNVWECEEHKEAYAGSNREQVAQMVKGHLINSHGVPADLLESISKGSEREQLLCNTLFWLTEDTHRPDEISDLDKFLRTLENAARRLWTSNDWRGARIEVLQREKDEYELAMSNSWEKNLSWDKYADQTKVSRSTQT